MVDMRDNLISLKTNRCCYFPTGAVALKKRSRLRSGGVLSLSVPAQARFNSKSAQEVKLLLGGSRLSYPKNMSLPSYKLTILYP